MNPYNWMTVFSHWPHFGIISSLEQVLNNNAATGYDKNVSINSMNKGTETKYRNDPM